MPIPTEKLSPATAALLKAAFARKIDERLSVILADGRRFCMKDAAQRDRFLAKHPGSRVE